MRTVFLSYGFEDEESDSQYPEIDRVEMQAAINYIASAALRDGYRLVVRDHPAITPMLQFHFENERDNLLIAKEDADLRKILYTTKPEIVFLIGGGKQVADDAGQILADHPKIALLPLSSTGGAAQSMADKLVQSGSAHPILREFAKVAFGFKIINKAMPGAPIMPKPPRLG